MLDFGIDLSWRRMTRVWVLLLFWATLPATPVFAAAERSLTILFTNDTHDRLESFQQIELKKQVGGVLRRETYFAQVKRETANTLILDAGDVFQGTPFYNFYLGEPDIKAMNLLGYQAMTVGNHDFDNGLLNLKKQTQYAFFPVLNANIVDEKTGLLMFRPFEIFDVHGLKIAVIGLMSEHAWQAVMPANKQGLKLLDPVQAANQLIPQLRPRVDLIVTLHHMGIWADEPFARQVPGVDVIIGGHSHTLMAKAELIPNGNPNGINGTLLQHAYFMGAYVGRIDLKLDAQGKIVKYDSQLVLLDDKFDPAPQSSRPDPLQQLMSSYGDKLKASMGQVIGEALDDMGTDGKYDGPFALGSLVADVLRESQGTEVGIMNTGGVRAGVPKGPITVGGVYEVMPFDNTISTFKLKGQDLRQVVEISASRLGVSKNMQFSGLVYSLRDKQVSDIRVQGKPLDPNRVYTVVAPDYVLDGNEDLAFPHATEIKRTGLLIRDLLMNYVKRNKQIRAPRDQRLIRLGAS